MFVLTVLEDKIKTTPGQFDRDTAEVLIEQIELKYSNRILPDIGLFIAFYDFVEVGDPYIYPSEGSVHQLVRFRMITFRPFTGEVIVGKILSSDCDGIRASVGFFDDIFIPSFLLPSPSEFQIEKGIWVWKYSEEDSQLEFPMEIHDEIRFRVRTVDYISDAHSSTSTRPEVGVTKSAVKEPPMKVVCCANEDGLGLPAWWQ